MSHFRGFWGDFFLYRILVREFTTNDKIKKYYHFNHKNLVKIDNLKKCFDKLFMVLDNTSGISVNRNTINVNLKTILNEKSYLIDLSRDIENLEGNYTIFVI